MELFKSRRWSFVDIGLLKSACVLLGMIAGAYLADVTRQYLWIFVVAAVVLLIKPAVSYFREDRT